MPALFELGQLVATPGALAALPQEVIVASVRRHLTGDWGDLSEEDAAENRLSVEQGFRILSAYSHAGTHYWLITEADRSSTTVLLPEEY